MKRLFLFLFFPLLFLNKKTDAQNQVKILNYHLYTSKKCAYTSDDSVCCKNWHYPNRDTMQKIISIMRPMADGEIHGYDHLPCYITGHLIYNSIRYWYQFSSGGFVELVNDLVDGSTYIDLKCTDSSYSKYFLEQGSNNEDE